MTGRRWYPDEDNRIEKREIPRALIRLPKLIELIYVHGFR